MESTLFLLIAGTICLLVSAYRLPKTIKKFGERKENWDFALEILLIMMGLILTCISYTYINKGIKPKDVPNIMTPEDLSQEIHRIDGPSSNTSHGTLVPLVDGKGIPYAVMNPADPNGYWWMQIAKTSYVKKKELTPGKWILVDANYVEPAIPYEPIAEE